MHVGKAVIAGLAMLAVLRFSAPGLAQGVLPSIVAAQNFYGDVAGQVAGPGVPVTSIVNSPDQDPHAFEASPSTARALSAARIVVYNGLDYDPWMAKLVRATRSPERQVLVVASLLGRKAGANPHLWYDPAVMPAVAKAVANALATVDPANADGYNGRLAAFTASLQPLDAKVAAMRTRFAGTPVTATEPVFGYMATALGLDVRNERFQLAVMNGTEPRPSDVKAFEADLRGKKVRVMFYNGQATGPAAQRLLRLAREAGIAVVAVTETQPAGMTYQAWMLAQLDALETALAASS